MGAPDRAAPSAGTPEQLEVREQPDGREQAGREQAGREQAGKEQSAVTLPAVRRYVLGVVLAGAALTVAAALLTGATYGPLTWTVALPLLVVGFVLADLLQLTIEVRKGTVALPLTDFAIVGALFTVPFPVALLAAVTATVARGLQLRQHRTITAYNTGSALVELAVAYLVATAVRDVVGHPYAAVLLGMLAATVVSTGGSLALAEVMGGRGGWAGRLRVATTYLVLGLLNPVLALVGVQLLGSGPTGWTLLAGLLVTFVIAYRSYAALVRERHDLDLVHEIAATVTDDGGGGWREVAELVRQQFNAGRVVLRLPDGAGTVVVGQARPGPEPCPAADEPGAGGPGATPDHDDPVAASVGAEPLLLRVDDVRPELGAALRARGATEVLLARVGEGPGAGVLEIHDRQHQSQDFGPADVRLLGTLTRHLGTAVDNRRLVSQLRHDAYHDRLTGMANRLGFVQRSAAALAGPAGQRCAVLVADLGAVDDVNDALGHEVGDELVTVAGRRLVAELARRVGPDVLVAHFGGERFAALLPGADAATAERLGADLAAALGDPYPLRGLAVEAEPAIGVAVSAGGRADVEQLVQQADVAVVEARAAGQPARLHHPAMGQKFLRRFQLVTQFRAALESGEIVVHYQPQISLASREVIGAEALVRWTHPELGPVDPGELVRVLEATGLMDALTAFVLADAVGLCAGWQRRGLPLGVAVNVSVRNLLAEDFPAAVARVLGQHGLDPGRLTLEITETSVMGDAERTLPVLRRLHALGVMLSVDDFGTGYSSLSYLRKLPVDEVKIDKSFVLDMDTDLADHAVVRAITELGHSLGMRVVAEGVETDVVREQLAVLGADAAQGFLVARAMAPAQLEAWRTSRRVGEVPGLSRADVPELG